MLNDLMTNDAVLAELGRRLERHRLQRNLTQDELAGEAGVGRATLQRLERGKSVQTVSLIKLLRVLGLLSALDAALPEALARPIAQLDRERARGARRRARAARSPGDEAESDQAPWVWRDESERST